MKRPAAGPILAGVGLATALLFFVGLAGELPSLRAAVKPFPVLALAGWVVLRCPQPRGRLTAAGLTLSAVGDLVLEAGRASIVAGGRTVEILYGENPRVSAS